MSSPVVQIEKPLAQALSYVRLAADGPSKSSAPARTPSPPQPGRPAVLPPGTIIGNPPPKGFRVLAAPVGIPDGLPDIDLTRTVTNEADFSGRGVAGGVANGVVGGTGPLPPNGELVVPPPADDAGAYYFQYQVERPVRPRAGNPAPQFPALLASAHVAGYVLTEFIVDTSGTIEPPSIKIVESTDELFTVAVRRVLPQQHFYPAEAGEKKVRQLVQQPFTFVVP